jgi:hypothetical protein
MTFDDCESETESGCTLTLREAAEHACRSVTTLRRYIRSGRLHAEKRYGRFGPEYFVSIDDMAIAGLAPAAAADAGLPKERPRLTERSLTVPRTNARTDAVPIVLYQELQLKHEQLLVQYGMVRVGGVRALELGGEVEELQSKLEAMQQELIDVRNRSRERERHDLQELSAARLELEGRGLEIAAFEEKVRTLEMLTRNAVTNESIEEKYQDVVERTQKVQRMERIRRWPVGRPAGKPARLDDPEH